MVTRLNKILYKLKLYSYVVDHDYGFAPNPFHEYCTLVHCMFSKSSKRNLVEMVKQDYDSGYEVWVTGTGGVSSNTSGHGTIIYLMKVNDAIPVTKYYTDEKYKEKKHKANGTEIEQLGDRNYHIHTNISNRYALISNEYFYFGKNAIEIDNPEIKGCLEKRGPRYKRDFEETFIKLFLEWANHKVKKEFETNSYGMYGLPCTFNEKNDKLVKLCKKCCQNICVKI